MARDEGPPAGRLSETAEHYLEAIYYIAHEGDAVRPSGLAEWLGVSAPTVTVTLHRLARDGWLEVGAGRDVALTPAGEAAAAAIVRRHRILERWLVDVLGLDWAVADREASLLAHGASELVTARLDEQAGHPRTCPHGNPIPGRATPPGGLVRLDRLEPGRRAVVSRISEVAEHEAPQLLRRLGDVGLTPGTGVEVRAPGVPVAVEVGGHPVNLEVHAARAVWVAVKD